MLGGTMRELGIYSVSRPHTDKQREGGMNEGREDMEKSSIKGGEEEADRWKERDEGRLWVTPDTQVTVHCDCRSALHLN